MMERTRASRRVRRMAMMVAAPVILVGALAACDSPAPVSVGASSTAAAPVPEPTLHMITNGDHRLAFHVTPGKLPAIVLDAGGGLDSSYWKDLVPTLAKDTGSMIITYDRAGMGASDEVPGAWKVQDAVSDLEAGLRELKVTHDVVLVSHSIAGEIATNFTHDNPEWVSGAVLVDANLPNFFTDTEIARLEAVTKQQVETVKQQPSTKQNRQLLAVAANFGPAHIVYHDLAWPVSVPATVIVSEKTPFDGSEQDAQAWRDAQAAFAKAATNRQLVVATGSSHDVPVDKPAIVIKAIDDMVAAVS